MNSPSNEQYLDKKRNSFWLWLNLIVGLFCSVKHRKRYFEECRPCKKHLRGHPLSSLCSANKQCLVVPSQKSTYYVEAIEVVTSSDLEVVNGTDVKLKCTFKSTHPLTDKVSVSWSFKPLGNAAEEMFFHYQGKAYAPTSGLFVKHAVWSGDVMKGDASITLQNVQFTFNGTYSCHVRNPPDIQGVAGEIRLKVVQKVSFSEIGMLAIAVGGSIGIILLILTIYVCVRLFRRKNNDIIFEMEEHRSKNQLL